MPWINSARIHPEVVPQVGANLYLDTALDPPEVTRGNRHWLLSGSCVLVGPDKLLTIGHALMREGKHAAFFPFEGIVLLKEDPIRQFPYGDSVVLATLEHEIKTMAPLPYLKVRKRSLLGAEAWVGGFGDWKGISGAEIDGLQRMVRVQLGLPWRQEGRKLREDNLDISWWSPNNGGVEALLDNSGGPLLRSHGEGALPPFGVVGITRERKGPQQVCSWITRDRDSWLRRFLGRRPWKHAEVEPRATHVRQLVIGRAGHLEHLRLPAGGANQIKATLSATGGMVLQMRILPTPAPEDFLSNLGADDEASGRFLAREAPLAGDVREVAIGIVPVTKAPAQAERVAVQLCCMFL